MKLFGITVERVINPGTAVRFTDEVLPDRSRIQQIADAQKIVAEIALSRNIVTNLAPAECYHFFDDSVAFRAATRRLTGALPSRHVAGITQNGHSLIWERNVSQDPSCLVHEAVHNIASRSSPGDDVRRIRRRAPGLNEIGVQEITNESMYLLGGLDALDYPSAYDDLLIIGNHFLPRLHKSYHPPDFVRRTLDRDVLHGRADTLRLTEQTLGGASLRLWEAFNPGAATLADSIQLARGLELPGAVTQLEGLSTPLSGFTALFDRVSC